MVLMYTPSPIITPHDHQYDSPSNLSPLPTLTESYYSSFLLLAYFYYPILDS